MQNYWKELLRYLPRQLALALKNVDSSAVREVRLRREQPLMLSTASGEMFVLRDGQLSAVRCPSVVTASEADLEETVLRLCGYAVHTHQEELRAGYVTTESGLRVGVGGTVSVVDGKTITVGAITSLCVRVSRSHHGCSAELCRLLQQEGELRSMLLCGQPSSGKTSLLRDMAKRLSEGSDGRRWRVTVVDERGELSYGDELGYCDVIRGCPKPEGIRRAIRLFAPDIVIFDEWGTAEETAAVLDALPCGVAVATSCHAGTLQAICDRPVLSPAVSAGFTWLVELTGHRAPGQWNRVVKVEDWLAEMAGDLAAGGSVSVARQQASGRASRTREDMGAGLTPGRHAGNAHCLQHPTDPAAIERAVPHRQSNGVAVSAEAEQLCAGEDGRVLANGCREGTDGIAGVRPRAVSGVWRTAGANGYSRSDSALPDVCRPV